MNDRRARAIKQLLRDVNRGGVRRRSVLEALARVPRERFLTPDLESLAWENRALPIGQEQTISQPLVVGLMTQALNLRGTEKVLEIGTGSGYQAAILCELARQVISVERVAELSAAAGNVLSELGYRNIQLVVGDGTLGWPPEAPYDRIIVTAAAPDIPHALLQQLSERDGSRLVVPIGGLEEQELIVVERRGTDLWRENLGPVRFVPLIGSQGYQPDPERG